MKDSYHVSLKLILKDDQGEILVLKGLRGSKFDGYHDVPGGRIEDSEFHAPYAEILKRETKEEIGEVALDIELNPVAIGRHESREMVNGKNIRVFYVFFEARYRGGDIVTSAEHEGYRWLDISKIKLEEYFISGILEGMQMYRDLYSPKP